MGKQDPKTCRHFTLRRIVDHWYCIDCGLEVNLEKHGRTITAVKSGVKL